MNSRLANRKKPETSKQGRLNRFDWLAAARDALIEGGIESVKVDRLARKLKVTRGGFYWHFSNRDDLLDALLAAWEEETNAVYESALIDENGNGKAEFLKLIDAWIAEDAYNPAYDAAVRDWARTSDAVATAIRRVDDRRIQIIKRIFDDMGFSGEESFIRARVTYFHQVGYYTLGLKETTAERRRLLKFYLMVLTGGKLS